MIVGLAPLYFFAAPLMTVGLMGYGAIAAIAAIGVMPIMPAAGIHEQIRKFPGSLLFYVGLFGLIGAVKALLAGLPGMGPIIAVSMLALFSGIGLRAMISSLQNPRTKQYELNEAPYIGGFAAAVAIAASLSAALLGMTGTVPTVLMIGAFLLSPLLLYHLPGYLWSGIASALSGFPKSMALIYDVLRFYRHEAHFLRNMSSWFGYWTRQSRWYAPMFIIPWTLMGAAWLAEAALAVAFGAVVALARAPSRFMWGASRRKYIDDQAKLPEGERGRVENAWWPRFWGGFNNFLVEQAEGSKERIFDRSVKFLIPTINEKSAKTSRPTFAALAALSLARLGQFYWLARTAWMLLWLPLLAIPAALEGRRAANSPAPIGDNIGVR